MQNAICDLKKGEGVEVIETGDRTCANYLNRSALAGRSYRQLSCAPPMMYPTQSEQGLKVAGRRYFLLLVFLGDTNSISRCVSPFRKRRHFSQRVRSQDSPRLALLCHRA